jgi:hypothetical protein
MSENEMGNRGSKSILKTNIVKEQRVDGSWCFKNNNVKHLRYTLMDGESRYQVKIPSKQLNIKNLSTAATLPSKVSSNVNPWFWTGLIDAEGSFSIIITKKNKTFIRLGYWAQISNLSSYTRYPFILSITRVSRRSGNCTC